MSTEIISNLQTQLKIYQQMFEQLENDSISAPSPILTSSTSTVNNIIKPKTRYIKTEDILKLFNISKVEYNNILVKINNILNPLVYIKY